MKTLTTEVKFLIFLCFSFIKKQPKFWPTSNIALPGSSYSLHGYSGRLGARLTSVKKTI
jgi:hypothetical protein